MPNERELRAEQKRRLYQLLLIKKGINSLDDYIKQTKAEMDTEDVAYVLQQLEEKED